MKDAKHFSIDERLHTAAQAVDPEPGFSENLLAHILEQPQAQPRKTAFGSFLSRPLWISTAALIAIALTIVLVGPTRVANAFTRLIGYIPGIGFVTEDSGILYLPEPVRVEQDGINLIVEQAVADANGITIVYHIDGLDNPGVGGNACFYDGNRLRMGDSDMSRPPSGGSVAGSQAQLTFFPLPEGVTHVTLLASMDDASPDCHAPEQWSVDLDLVPMPADVELATVLTGEDLQPDVEANEPSTQTDALPQQAASATEEVTLIVDQMALLDDGYVVHGHVEWKRESWTQVSLEREAMQVVDASGKNVPISTENISWQDNEFEFFIPGKEWQAPLTLHVEAIHLLDILQDVSFTFDTGENPQVGQEWVLDQELDLNGQKIVIRSAQAIYDENNGGDPEQIDGYAFTIEHSPEVHHVNLIEPDWVQGNIWMQILPVNETTIRLESFYSGPLLTGEVTFDVTGIEYTLPGNWQVSWQLP